MIDQLSKSGRALSRRLSLPRHYLKTHMMEFAQIIGPSSWILDIGSGSLRPYQSSFDSEHYAGIDYFEQADVKADASSLPFSSRVVSVVLITEVLEHLPYPARALQEINRVLCSGGRLVLTALWVLDLDQGNGNDRNILGGKDKNASCREIKEQVLFRP